MIDDLMIDKKLDEIKLILLFLQTLQPIELRIDCR